MYALATCAQDQMISNGPWNPGRGTFVQPSSYSAIPTPALPRFSELNNGSAWRSETQCQAAAPRLVAQQQSAAVSPELMTHPRQAVSSHEDFGWPCSQIVLRSSELMEEGVTCQGRTVGNYLRPWAREGEIGNVLPMTTETTSKRVPASVVEGCGPADFVLERAWTTSTIPKRIPPMVDATSKIDKKPSKMLQDGMQVLPMTMESGLRFKPVIDMSVKGGSILFQCGQCESKRLYRKLKDLRVHCSKCGRKEDNLRDDPDVKVGSMAHLAKPSGELCVTQKSDQLSQKEERSSTEDFEQSVPVKGKDPSMNAESRQEGSIQGLLTTVCRALQELLEQGPIRRGDYNTTSRTDSHTEADLRTRNAAFRVSPRSKWNGLFDEPEENSPREKQDLQQVFNEEIMTKICRRRLITDDESQKENGAHFIPYTQEKIEREIERRVAERFRAGVGQAASAGRHYASKRVFATNQILDEPLMARGENEHHPKLPIKQYPTEAVLQANAESDQDRSFGPASQICLPEEMPMDSEGPRPHLKTLATRPSFVKSYREADRMSETEASPLGNNVFKRRRCTACQKRLADLVYMGTQTPASDGRCMDPDSRVTYETKCLSIPTKLSRLGTKGKLTRKAPKRFQNTQTNGIGVKALAIEAVGSTTRSTLPFNLPSKFFCPIGWISDPFARPERLEDYRGVLCIRCRWPNQRQDLLKTDLWSVTLCGKCERLGGSMHVFESSIFLLYCDVVFDGFWPGELVFINSAKSALCPAILIWPMLSLEQFSRNFQELCTSLLPARSLEALVKELISDRTRKRRQKFPCKWLVAIVNESSQYVLHHHATFLSIVMSQPLEP